MGCGQKFIIETELIEEAAQAGIVVVRKAFVCTERVGYAGQWLFERGLQQLLVGHVVGHLAQAVHIIGKADKARLALSLGQDFEGVADHRCARDLAKGADVRQSRWPITRLEDDRLLLPARHPFEALDEAARFLERPCLGVGEKVGWNGFMGARHIRSLERFIHPMDWVRRSCSLVDRIF